MFPELGKSRSRSYSHGQLVVPDDEGARTRDGDLVRFKENGLLEGVSKWRFRCVFGGIVLSYFVSTLKII